MGKPFDRKQFFMEITYYVEKGWGSYNELIELSMKDFHELRISIESKMQEDELRKTLGV